jgi:predicted small secreted protein
MVAKYSVLSAVLLLTSLLVLACGNGEGKRGAGKDGPVGTAQLYIQTVPGDVQCIRITASSASRSRTDAFDVTPGQSATLTMAALQAGSVTFTGDAFNVACADIGPSSRPTWLSDPVTADISPGQTTDVTMVMRPVGGARIGVDFQDAGAPTGGSGGTGGSNNGGSNNGGSNNGGSNNGGSNNGGSNNGGSGGNPNGPPGTWDQSTWDNASWQ